MSARPRRRRKQPSVPPPRRGQRRPTPNTFSTSEISKFNEIGMMIEQARRDAGRAVNLSLIELYWRIGEVLSRRIERDGWGKGTVQALSLHLSRTQRGVRGFSPQNLWRMRQFFEAYRSRPALIKLVKQLPWSSNLHILAAKDADEREYYLRMSVARQWNVRELSRQIEACAFERSILRQPKLSTMLREMHPDAAEHFKDSYALEFAELSLGHSEEDLHSSLLRNLGSFIKELGRDFCFVGSQYPVQVGHQDFLIDLVFFHRGLCCLVAFELKVRKFHPEDLGKLSFYVEALDRDVKKAHERPSIGVLLCATKDDEVVEYALARTTSPTLVAEYQAMLPPKRLLRRKLREIYACVDRDVQDPRRALEGAAGARLAAPRRAAPKKRSAAAAPRRGPGARARR